MNMASIKKALIAGIMGSAVMTAFNYVARFAKIPQADYQSLFTSRFGSEIGWFAFLMAAVIVAHLYGSFFKKKLPSHSWRKGAVYAAGIWAVVQVVLMPIMGQGIFPGTALSAFGALLTLAMYGATVGYLYEH